jgi:hypothetical protein
MQARLVLAALLVAAAAGCGGQSKHAAVSDYIMRVNALEASMAAPLGEVTQANREFAQKQSTAGADRRLQTSVRTMRKLRARLAGIDAPREAAHLRSLLLSLVDREVGLAHEVEEIAQFVPRYQAALSPLANADTQLKQTLAASAKGSAATKALDVHKADALASYARLVDSVLRDLHTLSPPPVWRPAYATQLNALAALRASATELAAAVRANRAAAIPGLLRRFDAAAIATQRTDAQRRQIAAVHAYDARIRAVGVLAARIQKERTRLQAAYS